MEQIVTPEQDGLRVDAYVQTAFAHLPRWARDEIVGKRQIKRAGVRLAPQDIVCHGEVLTVYLPKGVAQKTKEAVLDVVYEDENILLVNKPQGLGVDADAGESDSLLTRARAYVHRQGGAQESVELCHRLDAQTGGLLLLSKNAAAQAAAYEAFASRQMDKRYCCRVVGMPREEKAELHAYLRKDAQRAKVQVLSHPVRGAQEIATAYRVVESGAIARLEVQLLTGRTHQIRAHLAFIGHPILGDDKYGDRAANRRERVRRQQLWATDLTFHAQGALAYMEGKHFHVAPPF